MPFHELFRPISPEVRLLVIFAALLAIFIPSARGLVLPNGITVSVPANSNNPINPSASSPYTDDVNLDSITFGTTTYNVSAGQIAAIQSAYVVSGRADTNAEWGDNDNGSDGNPDPFTRVGINPFNADGSVNTSLQESTDPAIQDIGLASAFSSLSLSEITDGEGNTSVTNFIFSFGISDNDNAVDSIPEILLFERGNNDSTTVRAIIGGTYANPTLQGAVTIGSGVMWNTGIYIDTTEINNGQELGAVGIDLNEFGISDGTIVYGLQIETDGGDFGGFFQAAEDPDGQFSDDVPEDLKNPTGTVPEPSAFGLIVGLAAMACCMMRRNQSRSL